MDRLIHLVQNPVADIHLLELFVFGVGPCAVAQEDVNQIVFGVHPDADAREAKVPVCERARAVAA